MSDDVSRETSATPSTPDLARGAFPSERWDLVERYAHLLATEGVLRGLIGPRETPRLWDRHLLNSAALASFVPERATVCDVGSGAGLPGIVLAIARPDVHVTLLEPLLRRTTFLSEVVEELGLGDQVIVDRGRAEERHGRERYDVVTSRAVAPLDRLLRWSMPLVDRHGVLLAMKGSSAAEEVVAAGPVLAELGCAGPEVLTVDEAWLVEPTCVVRVAWADPPAVGLPGTPSRSRRPRSRGDAR